MGSAARTHASQVDEADEVSTDTVSVVEAPAVPSAAVAVPGRMRVGAADDHAEKSADQMADAALSRLSSLSAGPQASHDQHSHGPGCDHVRRSVAPRTPSSEPAVPSADPGPVGFAGGELDGDTEAKIKSSLRRGSPLAAPVRREMETAFGHSFDSVRVHDDPAAAGLNQAVSARAFTTGKDIYFGAGQYRPGDPDGQRVLAHELAHVVQDSDSHNASGVSVGRLFDFLKKKSPAQIEADAAKAVAKKQEADAAKATKVAAKSDKSAVAQAIRDNAADVAARQKRAVTAGVAPALGSSPEQAQTNLSALQAGKRKAPQDLATSLSSRDRASAPGASAPAHLAALHRPVPLPEKDITLKQSLTGASGRGELLPPSAAGNLDRLDANKFREQLAPKAWVGKAEADPEIVLKGAADSPGSARSAGGSAENLSALAAARTSGAAVGLVGSKTSMVTGTARENLDLLQAARDRNPDADTHVTLSGSKTAMGADSGEKLASLNAGRVRDQTQDIHNPLATSLTATGGEASGKLAALQSGRARNPADDTHVVLAGSKTGTSPGASAGRLETLNRGRLRDPEQDTHIALSGSKTTSAPAAPGNLAELQRGRTRDVEAGIALGASPTGTAAPKAGSNGSAAGNLGLLAQGRSRRDEPAEEDIVLAQSMTTKVKTAHEGASAADHLGRLAGSRAARDAELRAATIAASKQTLKDTDKAQKTERQENLAGRAAVGAEIEADQGPDSATSARANELHAEMETLLASELAAVTRIGKEKPKLSSDEVLEQAYQEVWMAASLSKAMKAVRPNRKTEAARLAWATRAEMAKEAIGGDASKPTELAPLGSLLRKRVERMFEEIETEFDAIRAKPAYAQLPDDAVRRQAKRKVLARQTEDDRKLYPTDEALISQAQIDARARLRLRPTPPAATKKDAVDTVLDLAAPDGLVAGIAQGVIGAASAATGAAGSKADKALNPSSAPTSLAERVPGGVGDMLKKDRLADESLASGKRSGLAAPSNKSAETLATQGMGQVKDVFMDVLTAAASARIFFESLASTHQDKSPRNIKKSTQSMADSLSALTSAADNTAKLAGTISSEVVDAITSICPVFSLVKSITTLVSKILEVADVGERMSSVNQQLQDAYARKSPKGLDVLVYPLLGVQSSFVKKLEMVVWEAGESVINFSTSVASLVTAGGFGVPAAIDASTKVLSALHSFGHFVATEVLTYITLDARADTANALEGAAEHQMKNDPASAVNNIIMAARKGSAPAIKFVEDFGVTPEQLQSEKIVNLAAPILKAMGKDADPKTAYAKFKEGLSAAGAMGKKWSETGTMAAERDELDGKAGLAFDLGITSRGILWRLQMMMRRQPKHERSMKKNQVRIGKNLAMASKRTAKEDAAEKERQKVMNRMTVGAFAAGEFMGMCGGVNLAEEPSAQQLLVFAGQMVGKSDDVILAASKNQANSEPFRNIMTKILEDRAMTKAKIASGAKPEASSAGPAPSGA